MIFPAIKKHNVYISKFILIFIHKNKILDRFLATSSRNSANKSEG